MKYLLGVDLGGTKIEVALLNAADYTVVERTRIPTDGHLGYDNIIKRLSNLIIAVCKKYNFHPDHIGIGTPGSLDPIVNKMKNCNTTALNGRPMKDDLQAILGYEVRMSNDANCFAVAEAVMGIVPDVLPKAEVVFGIILGTGVGGGVVFNGKVINGRQGIGGEWGHNFLDDSGGPCFCGNSGCVERIIAGPSLERYYHEQSGVMKKLPEIVAGYRAGNDTVATQTMDRLFVFFGKAISQIINVLDPDAIVIGGGVGNIDELYKYAPDHARKYVINMGRLDTLFLKPKLGDSAGVFGAAML
jgi:predicted NBD/HSP70 family sugar kinase